MGGAPHLPVAADRLVDLDHDRLVLVVAERDLERHLVHEAADASEVGLRAFGDDVEGGADLDVQRLVVRGVADPVFADELHATGCVGLIHTHVACRQRHAESCVLRVREAGIELDRVSERRTGALLVAVVGLLAIDDEPLLDRHSCTGQQAHLLGFEVVDGGSPTERVEVVFGERLLDELRLVGHLRHRARRLQPIASIVLLDAMEVAGDELQPRVVECRAAVVRERDPPVEVGLRVIAIDGQHVVCIPGEVAGQIYAASTRCAPAPSLSSAQTMVGRL